MIRSQDEIRNSLKIHQKRRQMGDGLRPIKDLAERAGVCRDTIYALLDGDRISEVSQIRLNRMLDRLAVEPSTPSRLMNVSFGTNGPKIGFGLGRRELLTRK
jgi:hypothetical protein